MGLGRILELVQLKWGSRMVGAFSQLYYLWCLRWGQWLYHGLVRQLLRLRLGLFLGFHLLGLVSCSEVVFFLYRRTRLIRLIKRIIVKVNGIAVYDNNEDNQTVNIKNLLEYDPSYVNTASNYFYYLDTNRNAEERPAQAAYNRGFAASNIVSYEVPLNRYGFFEALKNQLLPNSEVEIQVIIESDANLVLQAGDDCRVVIENFQLYVPRIQFNSAGTQNYMNNYLKPHKWTYLKEMVGRSQSLKQQTGTFQITTGINRPRHVFIYILNDARLSDQTQNPFLYDTFNVANNRKLTSCHLEVGNGSQYPEVELTSSTDVPRVFREVMKYVHGNNHFRGGTLLTRSNFETIFH